MKANYTLWSFLYFKLGKRYSFVSAYCLLLLLMFIFASCTPQAPSSNDPFNTVGKNQSLLQSSLDIPGLDQILNSPSSNVIKGFGYVNANDVLVEWQYDGVSTGMRLEYFRMLNNTEVLEKRANITLDAAGTPQRALSDDEFIPCQPVTGKAGNRSIACLARFVNQDAIHWKVWPLKNNQIKRAEPWADAHFAVKLEKPGLPPDLFKRSTFI